MFALRGLMVGAAFFGVCYCALSLLVVIVWQIARLLGRGSAFESNRSLFMLRIFPFASSALITLIFAMPAFYLLEGGPDEDMGTLVFCICSLFLFGVGCIRVMAAQFRASRVLLEWQAGSRALDSGLVATTLSAGGSAPPLLLCGISRPKVLISDAAIAALSPEELQVAIRHELSHLRFRDNLKKLILYGLPFPGMASLESRWQEASELAADEGAVASHADALNLAAALVKLCSLGATGKTPAFTTGFAELTALVNVRVHRLLDWEDAHKRIAKIRWPWFLLIAACVGCIALNYSRALLLTHLWTEWFIH